MCQSNYQEGSSGVAEARRQGGVSVLTHGLRAILRRAAMWVAFTISLLLISTLYMLTHLILMTKLYDRWWCCYSHFADKETEAQRS